MFGRQISMPLHSLNPRSFRSEKPNDGELRRRVHWAQDRYKRNADEKANAKPLDAEAGSFVRIKRPVLPNKLAPRYGPEARVISKPSSDTVRLEDGSTWSSDRVLPCAPARDVPAGDRNALPPDAPPIHYSPRRLRPRETLKKTSAL